MVRQQNTTGSAMFGWLRRLLGHGTPQGKAPDPAAEVFVPSVPDPMKSLGFTEDFLAHRRARYVGEDKSFAIANVECGVLFFMAFWSGPARQGFAELKQVLAEIDPGGRIELVVIDLDGCTEMHKVPGLSVAMLSGGYGETAWVKDGRVVSTTGRGFHPECFRENTLALLGQCLCP
jgi:hypothetical protein